MSRALTMEDGHMVRAMLIQELDKAGLGTLIRAGKADSRLKTVSALPTG